MYAIVYIIFDIHGNMKQTIKAASTVLFAKRIITENVYVNMSKGSSGVENFEMFIDQKIMSTII